jgi:Kef-type K+ transport system membrane component KefB
VPWEQLQQSSTFGFTVVALIVVFSPLIAERVRLPGLMGLLMGLLLGGALIGPNMFNVLPSFESLDSVGGLGVLYLIFLAGLQLDVDSFMRYRKISAGFGLLTAFIPLVLGVGVGLMLGIDTTAAVLIGSFWASFTLITRRAAVNRSSCSASRS